MLLCWGLGDIEIVDALVAFAKEYGSCTVPDLYRAELEDGTSVYLNRWHFRQKQLQSQGLLKPEREEALQKLVNEGVMSWELRGKYSLPDEPPFAMCVKILEAYEMIHKTCNIPRNGIVEIKDKKLFPLGHWLQSSCFLGHYCMCGDSTVRRIVFLVYEFSTYIGWYVF